MEKLSLLEIGTRLKELHQPWVLMMIGLPGTGKSSFIRRLDKPLRKVTVLSTDDLIEAHARTEGKTYTQVFNEVSFLVFKSAMEQAGDAARKAWISVIFDQTNMTVKSRKSKLSPFIAEGYTCIALEFSLSQEILQDRLVKRETETGKVISQSVLDKMSAGYIPPTIDEGFSYVWAYDRS